MVLFSHVTSTWLTLVIANSLFETCVGNPVASVLVTTNRANLKIILYYKNISRILSVMVMSVINSGLPWKVHRPKWANFSVHMTELEFLYWKYPRKLIEYYTGFVF